jgi:carbamate kinase
MRIVAALGGNALLKRGEPMTPEGQLANVRRAAEALAPVLRRHQTVVTHGNGPQVGLLALQSAAYGAATAFPLDVLGAESEGMIGYLIEQELRNVLGPQYPVAALLTQTVVDAHDPAFKNPTKPVGPVYDRPEAERIAAERGWSVGADGSKFRRLVPSPEPREILEIRTIEILMQAGIAVICAGGGGIPVARLPNGAYHGVEAVIDKDLASALLARELGADALVMLTDVAAVEVDHGTPSARAIRVASPTALSKLDFEAGSMGPKVAAAIGFVNETGGFAAIGRLEDVEAILDGRRGTQVRVDARGVEFAA